MSQSAPATETGHAATGETTRNSTVRDIGVEPFLPHPSHQRLDQSPRRPSLRLNPGVDFRKTSFQSRGTQGLRYPFCVRHKGRVSRPAPRRAIMTYSRCRGFMANCDTEGIALRQTPAQRETRKYPQSVGNLALADESLGVLQTPKAKTRSPRLSVVQDITEEEVDALAT